MSLISRILLWGTAIVLLALVWRGSTKGNHSGAAKGATADRATDRDNDPRPLQAERIGWRARFGRDRRSEISDEEPLVRIPAENLSSHYQVLLAGSRSGYSNVLQILKDRLSVDPLETDLFKDACLYAGLQTQLADWIERERALTSQITSQFEAVSGSPREIAQSVASLQEIQMDTLAAWAKLGAAYDVVFRHRFQLCHGLDDPQLLPTLRDVSLPDVGPELGVPPPSAPSQ